MPDANPEDVAPPPYKETISDEDRNSPEVHVPLTARRLLPERPLSTSSTAVNRNTTNRPPLKRNGRQNPGQGQGRRSSMDEESYVRAEVKEMERKMDGFTKVMCLGVTIASIILCCSPLCCH